MHMIQQTTDIHIFGRMPVEMSIGPNYEVCFIVHVEDCLTISINF